MDRADAAVARRDYGPRERGRRQGPGIVPLVEVRDGGPGRERTEWLRTNLQPQKQGEYSQVTVSLVLGDLTGGQMRALAALSRAYADGTVRVTVDQNLVLRWVKSGQVPGLYRRLAAAGLARPGAGTITDVTSCPGAESCRLAVTQSRGLARLIEDDLPAIRRRWCAPPSTSASKSADARTAAASTTSRRLASRGAFASSATASSRSIS